MGRKILPLNAADLGDRKKPVYLTKAERRIFGLVAEGDEESDEVLAHVALKYYNPSIECFSEWNRAELKGLSGFIEKINNRTWAMIYKSSGQAGSKLGNGLAYTPHKNPNKLPGYKELSKQISDDITFFELRVTGVARVHGFRGLSAFFLVCLDRDHQSHPM